ncbi:hypothetical protein TNCV_1267121, partial [Trichonephila clavipes]
MIHTYYRKRKLLSGINVLEKVGKGVEDDKLSDFLRFPDSAENMERFLQRYVQEQRLA